MRRTSWLVVSTSCSPSRTSSWVSVGRNVPTGSAAAGNRDRFDGSGVDQVPGRDKPAGDGEFGNMGCAPTTGASVPEGINNAPSAREVKGSSRIFRGQWGHGRSGRTLISDTAFGTPRRSSAGRRRQVVKSGRFRDVAGVTVSPRLTGTDHRAGYTDTTDLGIPSDLGRHRSRFGLRESFRVAMKVSNRSARGRQHFRRGIRKGATRDR